jgi:hypothetical protein
MLLFLRLISILFTYKLGYASNTCISADAQDRIAEEANRQSRSAPAWAIVTLVNKNTDISARNQKLAKALRPFAHLHNISVLMFSEHSHHSTAIEKWRNAFKDLARVLTIDTSRNGFNGLPQRYGYKYMCKFFAIDVYEYLRGYDYYIRMDHDSHIQKLEYDILHWAESNKLEYGFALRKLEAHGPTKQTLPLWSSKYLQNCNIQPRAVMDEEFSTCFNFYNNFHIGSVHFFLRPDVQHYLNSANASGHILSHRWGDSTIQAYAVRIFMDPARLFQVPEFVYVHQSHSAIVSTVGDGSESNVPQRLKNWGNRGLDGIKYIKDLTAQEAQG